MHVVKRPPRRKAVFFGDFRGFRKCQKQHFFWTTLIMAGHIEVKVDVIQHPTGPRKGQLAYFGPKKGQKTVFFGTFFFAKSHRKIYLLRDPHLLNPGCAGPPFLGVFWERSKTTQNV